MEEKRSHPRMAVNYEVFMNLNGLTLASRCRDISSRGIGLLSSEALDTSRDVSINVVLQNGAPSLTMSGAVRHCSANPRKALNPEPYLVGVEFDEETQENFPFLDIQGSVMKYKASHTVGIDAPADHLYRMIAEFERYPEWVKIYESAAVKERYSNGRGRLVEFTANAYVRKIAFALEYSYDDANLTLSWVGAGGDFLENSGRYSFYTRSDGLTAATYDLNLSFDFYMPSRIVRYFSTIVMRKSIKDFGKFAIRNL